MKIKQKSKSILLGTTLALFAGNLSAYAAPSYTKGDAFMNLAGEKLDTYPYFEFVKAVNKNKPLYIGIDTKRYPELVGETVDLYLIESIRETAKKTGSYMLTDVRGEPTEYTFRKGGFRQNTIKLAEADTLEGSSYQTRTNANTGLGHKYEIVIDRDRDGKYSKGDIIDGLAKRKNLMDAGVYIVNDTTQEGPLSIKKVDYTITDEVAKLNGITNFPDTWEMDIDIDTWEEINTTVTGSRVTGEILYYPEDVENIKSLPLVVISHGSGHEYSWYDYIGKHLASYGYLVMSHENGSKINSPRNFTVKHMDALLDSLNNINNGELVGKVDTHNITFIGHSFGGMGVARAYNAIKNGEIISHWGINKLSETQSEGQRRNTSNDYEKMMKFTLPGTTYTYSTKVDIEGGFLKEPYVSRHGIQAKDIKFVESLAPAPGSISDGAIPDDVNYHMWIGMGDNLIKNKLGDLKSQSHRLFDRATGWRMASSFYGAGHAWFHGGVETRNKVRTEVYGAVEPWIYEGPKGCRVTEEIVHNVVLGMLLPLVKHFNEGNIPATDFFNRDYDIFHPAGVDKVKNECLTITNEIKENASKNYKIIDNFDGKNETAKRASSNAKVKFNNLTIVEGALIDNSGSFNNINDSDPFNGALWSSESYPNRGVSLAWDEVSNYQWKLPKKQRDISSFTHLSLNVAQIPGHSFNAENEQLNFRVILVDNKGHRRSVIVGNIPKAYDKEFEGPESDSMTGEELDKLREKVTKQILAENKNSSTKEKPHKEIDILINEKIREKRKIDRLNSKISERLGYLLSINSLKKKRENSVLNTSMANMKTVRIPLSSFTSNGSKINLHHIKKIILKFGEEKTNQSGAIMLDDVRLTNEKAIH